jgi:hypothetical protein
MKWFTVVVNVHKTSQSLGRELGFELGCFAVSIACPRAHVTASIAAGSHPIRVSISFMASHSLIRYSYHDLTFSLVSVRTVTQLPPLSEGNAFVDRYLPPKKGVLRRVVLFMLWVRKRKKRLVWVTFMWTKRHWIEIY